MKYLRQTWIRAIAVSVLLLVAAFVFADQAVTDAVRESASRSLIGVTVLFAICAAISIAMFTNYVRGLSQAYEDKVGNVRDLLEKFFDAHKDSGNADIQTIVRSYVIPLLRLNMGDWHAFEPVKEITPRIVEPASRLHKSDPSFLPRYLLRIEDTINQVGLLFVRRIVSQLHVDNVTGTFILVAFGIVVIALSNLLPQTPTGNLIVVWLSMSIVVLAVLELVLILSYLRQEAREELPESAASTDEEPNSTVEEDARNSSARSSP